MKKLVLVLVCAVLLTFFVAFNYLLWDKEQNTKSIETLEYSNENKAATIDALGREIKNLEDYNKHLNARIQAMETVTKDLEDRNAQLEQTNQEMQSVLEHKLDVIDALKQQSGLESLQDVAKQWIESINEGNYDAAYNLMAPNAFGEGLFINLSDFENIYRETVKNIELDSIELNSDEKQEDSKDDIILIISVKAEMLKASDRVVFHDGLNKIYFGLIYDKVQNTWMVSKIANLSK